MGHQGRGLVADPPRPSPRWWAWRGGPAPGGRLGGRGRGRCKRGPKGRSPPSGKYTIQRGQRRLSFRGWRYKNPKGLL